MTSAAAWGPKDEILHDLFQAMRHLDRASRDIRDLGVAELGELAAQLADRAEHLAVALERHSRGPRRLRPVPS